MSAARIDDEAVEAILAGRTDFDDQLLTALAAWSRDVWPSQASHSARRPFDWAADLNRKEDAR